MSTKVSESTGYTSNRHMSALGYIAAALVVVVLLPLLPLFAVAWLLWRIFAASDEREDSFEEWRNQSGRRPNDS